MAVDEAPPSLAEKLSELAELRESRDRAKDIASDWERSYRRCEREVIDLMTQQDPPLTSVRVQDLGTFTLQGRTFFRVTDLDQVLRWAEEAELVHGLVRHEDGTISVRFDVQTIPSDDGEGVETTLVSGILKGATYKKALSDHARQVLEDDGEILAGLDVSNTTFVQIRRQR